MATIKPKAKKIVRIVDGGHVLSRAIQRQLVRAAKQLDVLTDAQLRRLIQSCVDSMSRRNLSIVAGFVTSTAGIMLSAPALTVAIRAAKARRQS